MRKRLIYRCDDVGYTEVYDKGVFNVIDAGIGCSADVMFDAKNVVNALMKLKDRPWVSIGWHSHLWETPVLPPEEVPSLVNEEGRFKWGHRENHLKVEATYEDAIKEFEAQMELCYKYLGKYPDTAGVGVSVEDIPLKVALLDTCKKYGIAINFFLGTNFRERKLGETEEEYKAAIAYQKRPIDEKWAHKNIISCPISVGGNYDLKNFVNYKPIIPMTNLKWTEKEEIYFYGWHPGFLDDYILAESTSNVHRVREYADAMSDTYRDWIISNQIELINFRDALYDTNEYQTHLKNVNSPLYLGNMK